MLEKPPRRLMGLLIRDLACQLIGQRVCQSQRRAGDILAHFPVFVSFP
jgi:hypothetical protein